MTDAVNPVAVIHLRGRADPFVAEECEIRGELVNATGRTRERYGPNYSMVRWRERRSMSWPVRRIEEITWLRPR